MEDSQREVITAANGNFCSAEAAAGKNYRSDFFAA